MRIRAAGGVPSDAELVVPGDKSISHRSVMLGSLADGTTKVTNCLLGDDVLSTMSCFRKMGVDISVGPELVTIKGVGTYGLRAPDSELDAGNAGTCMRLISGVLSGQRFKSTLVGDASLSKRPMRRIIEPLQEMGAVITASKAGTAPLHIEGRYPLKGIRYTLPVASAQIKSAILLAGLYAESSTVVVEPEPVRDHTEKMLAAFGGKIVRHGSEIVISPSELRSTSVQVPGDFSSAAFLVVAALLSDGCTLRLNNVGLNPLRTGALAILQEMGGDIRIENERLEGGEPVGTLVVRSSVLTGIRVDPRLVSSAIDEFPIIFVAAAFAEGTTTVTDAAELRVKESDRIAAMVDGLTRIGIDAIATPDGAVIHGSRSAKGGCPIETHFDHRVAMAFCIASLKCREHLEILEADAITTSFPTFVALCRQIGMRLEEI